MKIAKFRRVLALGAVISISVSTSVGTLYATESVGGITQTEYKTNIVADEEVNTTSTTDTTADNNTKDVESKEEVKKSARVNVENQNITLMYKEDGLYFTQSTDGSGEGRKLTEAEYISLIDNLGYSIEDDIKNSYKILEEDNLEADHLKLKVWGEFLYLYADKTISSMPTDGYTLKLGNNNSVTIKGDRGTRQWISDELIPKVEKILVDVSESYKISVYKYIPSTTTYLGDFTYDTLKESSNLQLDFEVHPFIGTLIEGVEKDVALSVHSVGESYGLQLHREYVSVVNNVDNDKGVFVGLNDKENSCVQKVVNIGIFANAEDETITSPSTSNYLGIQDLAIDLSTGDVVKITSIDGYKFEKIGTLEDFGLNNDTVALKKLTDGFVAVPLMYKEFFQTSELIYPNGFTVDLTPVIFSDSPEVKVGENHSDSIERYVAVSGVVDARYDIDNGGFIILNGLGKTHYGRMSAWIWSGQADNYLSDTSQIRYLEASEKWYKANNKKDELKMYMKQYNGYTSAQASGKGLNPVVKVALVGGFVVMLGGSVALIVVTKKKKKEQIKDFSNVDASNLAFRYDDDEDDEEDNDM